MYDLMIVDDDKFIHDRIKNMIKWEEIGVRLVCEAEDSDTARELFLIHRPKIIITDIKIPIISGLELAKEILAIDPQVRFIIITGYTDFEFVRASVRLGAIDLLSKPILPEEITSSLKKAVLYFEKLKKDHISSQNIQLLMKDNLPLFQENFLSYLLTQKREITDNEIFEKFHILQIDLVGVFYSVVIICPNINGLPAADIDIILVDIKNTSEKQLKKSGYKVHSYYDSNFHLNCLLSWDKEEDIQRVEQTIVNIHDEISFFWNIKILSCIGLPISDITEIFESFNSAYIAYNYQGLLEYSSIINYINIARFLEPVILDENKIISDSILFFRSNNIKEIKRLVQSEIAKLLSSTKDSIQSAKKLIFELASSIISESISLGIDLQALSLYSEMYINIFSSNNVQSIMQSLLDFIEAVGNEIYIEHSKNKNHLINLAKDFIKDHLFDNKLDLEMVSNFVGLSSVYFCKLFHKEEGVSFNSYLNLKRIDKAKSLLNETTLKIFEVSYSIGYSNPKYFNYVFKRVVGLTPLEYRNSLV